MDADRLAKIREEAEHGFVTNSMARELIRYIEELHIGLKEILAGDYRGNRPPEQVIAARLLGDHE